MSDYIERYWRDATPEDSIKEPPMVARFRDYGDVKWTEVPLQLMGLCRASCAWFDTDGDTFDYCQVYDAPDPGEGWRLIDPHKEPLREGDEFMFCLERQRGWIQIDSVPTGWAEKNFYRRRIEQPKPEPRYEPFKWEDREQLRGRWITYKHEDGTTIETQINHLSENRREGFWFKSRNPKWLLENATFLDTGEPVGRKVE